MVKIPHGHSEDFLGGYKGVEQAATTISRAPLGQFWVDNSRKETGGFSGDGYGSYEEPPNIEIDPTCGSNAEVQHTTLLQGGDYGYSKVHDHLEAKVDSFQKSYKEDGMEHGGINDNDC